MTSQQFYHVFAGTYGSAEENAIEWLLFDSVKGTLKKTGAFSGIENPSFLTVNQAGSRLYSVSEVEEGEVVSFDIDFSNRRLIEINRQATGGASPCYISLDPEEKWLFTANYGGSIAVHPLTANGISPASDRKHFKGKSIVPERQESAHPHAIINVPDTDKYIVTDLGADRLYVYQLDDEAGRLELINEVETVPGSGPRHIAVHPEHQIFYVANELQSTISVYSYDSVFKQVDLLQQIGTIPADFNRPNFGADIHVSLSGSYLYVSNRGHHSITAYKLGNDGMLDSMEHAATKGEWPRNFLMMPNGQYILAANEHTNSITVMKIGEDGVPRVTEHVYYINSPVCLHAVAVKEE